jgi:predicted nucleic acid-binding protein
VIVLDTSALVEFLVGADQVAERVRTAVVDERLAAPHGVDLECASTLWGLVLGGKLPADEGRRALDLLGSVNLRRHRHVPLLPRVWELRHNLWPYDAAYVALAEVLHADLVTVDRKLEGVTGVRCVVRNLRDN